MAAFIPRGRADKERGSSGTFVSKITSSKGRVKNKQMFVAVGTAENHGMVLIVKDLKVHPV